MMPLSAAGIAELTNGEVPSLLWPIKWLLAVVGVLLFFGLAMLG